MFGVRGTGRHVIGTSIHINMFVSTATAVARVLIIHMWLCIYPMFDVNYGGYISIMRISTCGYVY